MLLLSIVFCRIQALFLSAGSHSWSLCFQSRSIHLLFLSAGWQSCSLRFQYSPIYLLSLSLLGHIHVLFTSDTVLHISICYSFLLGHFTVLFTSNTVLSISICYSFLFGHIHVLFTSNTVLYLCAIPLCHGSYYVLFASFTAITIWSYLFFEVWVVFPFLKCARLLYPDKMLSYPSIYPWHIIELFFFPIILHLILYPIKMLSYPSIYPWHIIELLFLPYNTTSYSIPW